MKLIATLPLLTSFWGAMAACDDTCPPVYIIVARGTTVPQGSFDLLAPLMNSLKQAYPGAEAISLVYPACGGQPSCGGLGYGESVKQGTANMAAAVNEKYEECPDTKIVLLGYSQGGHIIDNAYCGGVDMNAKIFEDKTTPITKEAAAAVKATIWMGSPRFQAGMPYNVGSCTAGHGFDPRPRGFTCRNDATIIQSFCNGPDPMCCGGNDGSAHGAYGQLFTKQAFDFINKKLSGKQG